jgi:hypothetical protein
LNTDRSCTWPRALAANVNQVDTIVDHLMGRGNRPV